MQKECIWAQCGVINWYEIVFVVYIGKALRSVAKIWRTSYRFVRQHCTIYDASYLMCVQLSANSSKQIIAALSEITNPSETIFENKLYSDGEREGMFVMYKSKSEYPLNAIVPVNFLWRQTTKQAMMWCWIHPATLPDSLEILKKAAQLHSVNVKCRSELQRYELRGPASTSVLGTVLTATVKHNSETKIHV